MFLTRKAQGLIFAALSAICYGLNPLGALHLYDEGLCVCTILCYRFLGAALALSLIMLLRRETFSITWPEFRLTFTLGALFSVAAITLYISYKYMDVGIASTLLFVFPIFVAILMAALFKERLSRRVVLSIAVSFIGIALLNRDSSGEPLSVVGVAIIMLSALTYAIYIIVVNRSQVQMPINRQTFYILLFNGLCIAAMSTFLPGETLQTVPCTARSIASIIMLALCPSLMSIMFLTLAVQRVGATLSAIMGALEPLTAVVIGLIIFGETLTLRLVTGMVLIVVAVLFVVVERPKREKKKVRK